VPGLGELPVAGRLFSQTNDSLTKTEIILLITPRLVRTLARPGVNEVEFAAGTESATGLSVGGGAPALPAQQPAPAQPAVVEPPPVIPQVVPQAPSQPAPQLEMVPFGGPKPAPQE